MKIKTLVCSIALIFPIIAFAQSSYVLETNIDAPTGTALVSTLNTKQLSLGYNLKINEQITIIGEDIPETGITSAYKTNLFYINSNGKNVTNFDWKLELPLEDGTFETYCTSNQQQFTIPALSNINNYYHTVEGDIKGVVAFSGLVDGKQVESKYSVTFELEPLVLKAEIVSKTPCGYDETYYDALLDIYYSGSHYVHVDLVEDGNSSVDSYFSDRPFYTQIKLKDIDSWFNATVYITIRNEYGVKKISILLPNWIEHSPEMLLDKSWEFYVESIEVYNLDGTYKTSFSTAEGLESLEKGIYILKYIGRDRKVLNVKKISK